MFPPDPNSPIQHPHSSPTLADLSQDKSHTHSTSQSTPVDLVSLSSLQPLANHLSDLSTSPMSATHHPILWGIIHPLFTYISPTNYLMKDMAYLIHTTIHVSQLTKYLNFDKHLRKYGNTAQFNSVPLRFIDFCNTWNTGISPDDPHHVSTVYLADNPNSNQIDPSNHPLLLQDFHISPTHPSTLSTTSNQPSSESALQADINQEFAALMVAKKKRQCQSYEE